MNKKKLEDTDLYALLGVEFSADPAEIKKSYRKKALECHPDKNPDNPKAAELFHELSKALEVLLDVSARAAYDKVINAKKAAKLRHRELDSKRQKLIEDLERREKEAELKGKTNKTYDERSDSERLQAEIERLHKEGSRLLEEEHERMRQQIASEWQRPAPVWESSQNRIKIKWKTSKTDENNGGYNEENLKLFLRKYGDIVALVISAKKKGSALVEYTTKEATEMAVEFEKGLPENPLTLQWLNTSKHTSGGSAPASGPSLVSNLDYESVVLRTLRQKAERQQIIDELLKEDQDQR